MASKLNILPYRQHDIWGQLESTILLVKHGSGSIILWEGFSWKELARVYLWKRYENLSSFYLHFKNYLLIWDGLSHPMQLQKRDVCDYNVTECKNVHSVRIVLQGTLLLSPVLKWDIAHFVNITESNSESEGLLDTQYFLFQQLHLQKYVFFPSCWCWSLINKLHNRYRFKDENLQCWQVANLNFFLCVSHLCVYVSCCEFFFLRWFVVFITFNLCVSAFLSLCLPVIFVFHPFLFIRGTFIQSSTWRWQEGDTIKFTSVMQRTISGRSYASWF